MDTEIIVPIEVQLKVLKLLPLATKLELRLVCRQFNKISVAAMELTLVWSGSNRVLLDRHRNSQSNTNVIRIQSIDDIHQSQLAARVFSLRVDCPKRDNPLQTMEEFSDCFEYVSQRQLDLELVCVFAPNLARVYLTNLAQRLPIFRLTGATINSWPTDNLQQTRRVSNYFLHGASGLQALDVTAHDLAGIQIVPPEWNSTLTTLRLVIFDPVNGAVCIQLMANRMRNLRTVKLDIRPQLNDKGFFKPLASLQELRQLSLGDDQGVTRGCRCEFPVFDKPLRNLLTLKLRSVTRLAKNPHLFKRMPNLESLEIQQDMQDFVGEQSFEADCRDLVDVLIDNCHAGSLPNLERLSLEPFHGRYGHGAEPFWVLPPTLDFDIARILMAAAKCQKLAFLLLDCSYPGEINCDVLLPSFEQCPVDYLLTSPRAIQVEEFLLEHFLAEPQLLLDYAIGMIRTGLRRLTLKLGRPGAGDRNRRLAQRAELQEVVTKVARLLILDVPKLSTGDVFRKTIHLNDQRFSETIVFIERDCGRKHEFCLTTMKNN